MNNWRILLGSTLEILRLRSEPGPTSNSIESPSRNEGHARFALTAEPPEPRIINFKGRNHGPYCSCNEYGLGYLTILYQSFVRSSLFT
jgi:hypothetical protein